MEQYESTYLDRFAEATFVAREKGAIFNSLAACAQGALESGWGRSELALRCNNLFGVKGNINRPDDWVFWTWEWDGQKFYRVQARFRAYPSYNEALVDYSNIIRTLSWYSHSIPHADPPHGDGDARAWLAGLMWPGLPRWSTEDPDTYIAKVTAIISQIGDWSVRLVQAKMRLDATNG